MYKATEDTLWLIYSLISTKHQLEKLGCTVGFILAVSSFCFFALKVKEIMSKYILPKRTACCLLLISLHTHLSILWLLSRFCSPSSPSFLSDQLALAQWLSTSATSSVWRRKCGAMPPLRELNERSEQALEASLLASSSEYMPGDSKRRLTGLRWVTKRGVNSVYKQR